MTRPDVNGTGWERNAMSRKRKSLPVARSAACTGGSRTGAGRRSGAKRTGYLGAAEEHGRLCDPEFDRRGSVGQLIRGTATPPGHRRSTPAAAARHRDLTPSHPRRGPPVRGSAREGRGHREQRSPVLVETHLAGRHRPAVPHAVDAQVDGVRRGSCGDESRVERARGLVVGDRRRRGREGPCDERAAEGRREVAPSPSARKWSGPSASSWRACSSEARDSSREARRASRSITAPCSRLA